MLVASLGVVGGGFDGDLGVGLGDGGAEVLGVDDGPGLGERSGLGILLTQDLLIQISLGV